jgi:hypothetical protein
MAKKGWRRDRFVLGWGAVDFAREGVVRFVAAVVEAGRCAGSEDRGGSVHAPRPLAR